jgi:nucleoside-diphosphate-sugar epimerase
MEYDGRGSWLGRRGDVRVLIIGGTGVISTPLTRQLVARGDDVTLYNRGQHEARFAAPVPTIHGDRRDVAAFEQQIAAAGRFDAVVDMIGFVPDDVTSAVRACRGRTDHYLFCSTVDVYAKPASRYPYREDEPHGGLGAYAVNKVACEAILREAHARGDLPVTIIRPAHTYGEGNCFVHTWGRQTSYIDRLCRGKPIVVHGDGQSLWTNGYADDVARAFVGAIDNPATIGRAYHTPGEEWLTWNQHHQGVAAALGAPEPELVHIPTDLIVAVAPERGAILRDNFQYNNIFDTTAARADLGYAPVIGWEEGVRRTVAWLDARGRIDSSDDDPFEDRLIASWRRLGPAMAEALA